MRLDALESRHSPSSLFRAYLDSPARGLAVTLGEWQWPQSDSALGYGTVGTIWLNPAVDWWDATIPPPPNRFDLYTVALHEYGHAAGLDHAETGFMQPTIPPGIRRDAAVLTPFTPDSWWSGSIDVSRSPDSVVAGAGPGGGPNVRVFDDGKLIDSFYAFDPNFHGGVNVGTWADLIVAGAGPGGGPHVKVWQRGVEIASFYAYDSAFTGGVTVTAGPDWIATGTVNGSPNVRFFSPTGSLLSSIYVGDPNSTQGGRLARSDHEWSYRG